MNEIYLWIRNIVIYMILNTIVMNLLGNSSYKKYVGMVSGLILVLLVISPVMKLLKIDEELDHFFQSNNFAIEASAFKQDLHFAQEKQNDLLFTEFQGKVRNQVEQMLRGEDIYLVDFELALDTDMESQEFGKIKRMDIVAQYQSNQTPEEKESKSSVKGVAIDRIVIGEKKEQEAANILPSPAEINVKNKLSDFYNIESDNININIQGGLYG